jgi:hypothetical protein
MLREQNTFYFCLNIKSNSVDKKKKNTAGYSFTLTDEF